MEHVTCPLSENARLTPQHPALITDQRTWTYKELDAEVHALCSFLENAGIKENQRIAFVAQTSPGAILLFFALFRLRAIACPLSHRLPQEQLTQYIQLLKAAHVLEPSLLPPDITRSGPKNTSIYLDDSATFLFTSGSSGTPKIACLKFANHYYNALGVIPALKVEPASRWLLSLPIFHVSGISILFRCFFRGATVVLSDLPISESIPKFGVSHLSVVPTQLIRLLKEPAGTLEKIKRSLKCLLLGGAPLSPTLLKEANLQSLPLYATYGMTEMASIIALSNANAEESSGKLLPYREVKLENDEICVRGKTLFQGYWDAFSETIIKQEHNGWFATKDLGRISKEGNIEIIGRKDRQFISGGENIQPEEIEQALCAIPGIRQASVLSIDDAEFGKRPVAFIDDETCSHTLDSIQEGLKRCLPSFKHPVRIMPYPPEAGIKPSLAILQQRLTQIQEASVKNRE